MKKNGCLVSFGVDLDLGPIALSNFTEKLGSQFILGTKWIDHGPTCPRPQTTHLCFLFPHYSHFVLLTYISLKIIFVCFKLLTDHMSLQTSKRTRFVGINGVIRQAQPIGGVRIVIPTNLSISVGRCWRMKRFQEQQILFKIVFQQDKETAMRNEHKLDLNFYQILIN